MQFNQIESKNLSNEQEVKTKEIQFTKGECITILIFDQYAELFHDE